jgi:hypothetical protein
LPLNEVPLNTVPRHDFRLAQEVAFHGTFEVGFGDSGTWVELAVERIEPEEITCPTKGLGALAVRSTEKSVPAYGDYAANGRIQRGIRTYARPLPIFRWRLNLYVSPYL